MQEAYRRICIWEPEEWHRVRAEHLQASEAAAVMDCSPWSSPTRLYDLKSGLVKEKDIGDKPYIRYGKAMEPLVREMFIIENPWFKVEYYQYDILESVERPWQGCTLDGEIEVIAENPWGLPIGAKGVLEIKTGSFRRRSDLEEWEGQIPQHYYCQVLHQLSCTGWSFAIVVGRLKRDPFKEEDNGFPEIVNRSRMILRKDVEEDIRVLEEEEADFWNRLRNRKRPPLRVSL